MWSSLLLLCSVQLLARITADDFPLEWKQCLTNCSCADTFLYQSLAITCHGIQDIDPGELSNQIDSMLSSNRRYGRLWLLAIVNSSLTHVPRSICRLTTLRGLFLQNNHLTQLPDNCLTNLYNLLFFNAPGNEIETLQNGLFDGLTKLEYIELNRNRISSVGSNVFAASSKLVNLVGIFLNENNFTSLGPWISTPCLIANDKMRNTNDLRHNSIPTYTNETATALDEINFIFHDEYKETSFLSNQAWWRFIIKHSTTKNKSDKEPVITNDLIHNDTSKYTSPVDIFRIRLRIYKNAIFSPASLIWNLFSTGFLTTNDKNDKHDKSLSLST